MEDNPMQPNGGDQQQPLHDKVDMPEYDWEDMDWLKDTSDESAPRQSAPRQSAPQQSQPQQSAPRQSAPQQNAPRRNAPRQNAPQQSTPRQNAPRQNVPPQNSPQQNVPRQNGPWQNAPQQNVPRQNGPWQNAPQQNAPRQNGPWQNAPQQNVPRQNGPWQNAPRQNGPWQNGPQQPRQQQPYPPQQWAYPPQQPVQGQPPRRPAQAEPWRDGGRAVAVEPDDFRPHRKGNRTQTVLLIILVVILAGGVLFAGYKAGSILLNYHRDRSAYNDLADEALAGLAEPNTTTEPGATPEPETQVRSEVPISVDWDYLHSINTDIVGWLYCPNTIINYPLMQTSDNDYYLHRSYDRQPNTAGALFADYNAAIGVTYSNFIVYGHNMKDGSMFATIYDYVDQEFYNQHPIMYLLTPTQNYRVDLIAAHIVESTLDNYPGYFQEGEYQNYLNMITSSSFFRTSANVSDDYQLITMSTCDYSSNYHDPRFLLHGLLVPVV